MPEPKRKGESTEDFISRCMSETKGEYPDQAQRYAVCKSYAEKFEKDMKQEELFILQPRKSENRGVYLTRCSNNSRMRKQFKNLKERMGFCLNTFNEYYSYWSKLQEFGDIPEDSALGECITREKAKGFDYKTAYRHCSSKVVVKSGPINLEEDLLVEPVEFQEMDVLGYRTKYFYLCPGAQSLFQKIVSTEVDDDTAGMVRSAAQIADNIFQIEKSVIDKGFSTDDDLKQAQILLRDFLDLMNEITEETGEIYEVDFMNRHIELIGSARKYEMGLEESCWEGYEAIGLKEVDGQLVPNCVPIKE